MPLVFIINGDIRSREALASVVRGAGWQVEVFADAQAFLRRPHGADPACLVLDVDLPDMCGLDLQALCADRPELPVIFTATCPTLRAAVLAMKAGAMEFLPAPLDKELLLNAVRAAIGRSRDALAHEAAMRVLFTRFESLSHRERQVMAHVIAGRMNKVIADELGISVITVKAHRGRVMRKMQAASLPDLVNMAARLQPACLTGDEQCPNTSTRTGANCSGSPHSQWPPHRLPVSPWRPANHSVR